MSMSALRDMLYAQSIPGGGMSTKALLRQAAEDAKNAPDDDGMIGTREARTMTPREMFAANFRQQRDAEVKAKNDAVTSVMREQFANSMREKAGIGQKDPYTGEGVPGFANGVINTTEEQFDAGERGRERIVNPTGAPISVIPLELQQGPTDYVQKPIRANAGSDYVQHPVPSPPALSSVTAPMPSSSLNAGDVKIQRPIPGATGQLRGELRDAALATDNQGRQAQLPELALTGGGPYTAGGIAQGVKNAGAEVASRLWGDKSLIGGAINNAQAKNVEALRNTPDAGGEVPYMGTGGVNRPTYPKPPDSAVPFMGVGTSDTTQMPAHPLAEAGSRLFGDKSLMKSYMDHTMPGRAQGDYNPGGSGYQETAAAPSTPNLLREGYDRAFGDKSLFASYRNYQASKTAGTPEARAAETITTRANTAAQQPAGPNTLPAGGTSELMTPEERDTRLLAIRRAAAFGTKPEQEYNDLKAETPEALAKRNADTRNGYFPPTPGNSPRQPQYRPEVVAKAKELGIDPSQLQPVSGPAFGPAAIFSTPSEAISLGPVEKGDPGYDQWVSRMTAENPLTRQSPGTPQEVITPTQAAPTEDRVTRNKAVFDRAMQPRQQMQVINGSRDERVAYGEPRQGSYNLMDVMPSGIPVDNRMIAAAAARRFIDQPKEDNELRKQALANEGHLAGVNATGEYGLKHQGLANQGALEVAKYNSSVRGQEKTPFKFHADDMGNITAVFDETTGTAMPTAAAALKSFRDNNEAMTASLFSQMSDKERQAFMYGLPDARSIDRYTALWKKLQGK